MKILSKPWSLILLVTILCVVVIGTVQANETINPADCTFNGYHLYGKIELVDSFPDVTAQVVTAFPELNVQLVNNFPNDCGQWQIVTAFPDTKVKIVESFPDIKIQYVDAFPGLP